MDWINVAQDRCSGNVWSIFGVAEETLASYAELSSME
jgi:hypothetical protein